MYQSANPLEMFAAYLGRMFGVTVGHVAFALFALLFVFIFWVLPWDRIISKAGFTGFTYKFLLGLFSVPLLLAICVQDRLGAQATEFIATTSVISLYLGLLILAFCPWSVHRKLRQLKDTTP